MTLIAIAFLFGIMIFSIIFAFIPAFIKGDFSGGSDDEAVSSQETAYTASAAVGSKVYLDIISIKPIYRIYEPVSLSSHKYEEETKELVCLCYLTDGGSAWVHISVDDYLREFDANAYFNFISTAPVFAVLPERRIHGRMVTAGSVNGELSNEIEDDLVEFESVDHPMNTELAEEVAFSQDLPLGSPVYFEVNSILPTVLLSTFGSGG